MPREIRHLADRVLSDPHVAELAHSRPVATVEQTFYHTEGGGKRELLERLLSDPELSCAIVFTRTKHRAKRLARQLSASGHRAVALQGNMSQSQRDRAMGGFRRRQFNVLVATDIAARGIDVEHVSHVVNFDMPGTADAYTHRIGRTGRAERTGKAFTFVTTEDRHVAREIEHQVAAPMPRPVNVARGSGLARKAPPAGTGRRRRGQRRRARA